MRGGLASILLIWLSKTRKRFRKRDDLLGVSSLAGTLDGSLVLTEVDKGRS